MRVLKSVVTLTVVIFVAVTVSATDSYYGTYGPITVLTDSSKVLIKPVGGITQYDLESVLSGFQRIVEVLPDVQPIDEFVVCSLSISEGYLPFLDSMVSVAEVEFAEPFYRLEDSVPLYIGQSFCAAFNSSVTASQIDSINTIYGASIQRELAGMPNVFLLLNSQSSGYRTLDLSNIYHDLPETRYAQPNSGIRVERNAYRLYDYYNEYQFHTKKVIGRFNDASVWDFAGLQDTVTVAVVDDGVAAHEDLPEERILAGRNFTGRVPDDDVFPSSRVAHGMACAGIIGASHSTDSASGMSTSSGVVSLNPYVEIIPVQIFDTSGRAEPSDIAEAITYAYTHGAEVISNSWGYVSAVYDYRPLTEAIEKATLFGRNGRGCPVVFSSGNAGGFWPDPNGVHYPANLDFCLAVGAVQLNDSLWDYSCFGPTLDLVAPSDDGETVGVWSLDQMGALGRNFVYGTSLSKKSSPADTFHIDDILDCPPGQDNIDYYCRFGGTSAACPVVSGTASLLLSRDSTLSAQAVYYILRNSAITELDWGTISPPDTLYGYGRVDAFRAVLSIARGDVDNSGDIDISDLNRLVDYLFISLEPLHPHSLLGDCSCDGIVDGTDLQVLIDHMFLTLSPLPLPCFEYGDYFW